MKRKILLLCSLFCWHATSFGANLLEVYQQALRSDPLFQEAISQRFSTKEGVPISLAAILPNAFLTFSPTIAKTEDSGTNVRSFNIGDATFNPASNTTRSYQLTLTVTQTVFNFVQFHTIASQIELSKGADATLNAALQDLMVRVATAYFAILRDEDNLESSQANVRAFAKQLDQVKQQYNVGLKTLTDVYTAQSSYDIAVAQEITAKTVLANDKENLRVITGVLYENLTPLSEDFPLIHPDPSDINCWVQRALQQNWAIKASQYRTQSAKEIIQQQFAGHLPTLDAEGILSRSYVFNMNQATSVVETPGPGTTNTRAFSLNLNVPIYSGGGVVAQTNQAIYNYKVAQQQTEQTTRDTLNNTRQSFMNVVSGISKIQADKQAILSTISSLRGLEAGYRVGTQTLVDVVNQQQKVFEARVRYAIDRYNFVNDILLLKEATGTLCYNDLIAINVWLYHDKKKNPVLEDPLMP